MNIQVIFSENNQSFEAGFGDTVKLPDESYKVGYDNGLSQGYDSGYAIGESEGYKDGVEDGFKDGKEQGYQQGITEGYENGYTGGFDAGKQAEYDAFWDAFQQNGDRRNYSKGFCGNGWTDETFKPKYDIIVVGSGNDFFPSTLMTDVVAILESCGVTLDLSECTHLSWGMSGMKNTRLPILNTPKVTTFANCFNADSHLHTIEKIILNDQGNAIFTSAFANCKALENIRFEGVIGQDIDFHWSTLLTKASITDIINHLSDDTAGKTLTLSKTAVNNAFTADEWSALESSKQNWTITLT